MIRLILLAGGLGNQLFQMAAAEKIFGNSNYTVFTGKLNNYSTKRKPISLKLLGSQHSILEPNPIMRLILSSKIIGVLVNSPIKIILKFCFDIKIISGYFQDCAKYLRGIHVIVKKIELENERKLKILKSKYNINSNDVGIHIRLGDYLTEDKFWVIDNDYIRNTLSKFTNIPRLIVFCEEKVPEYFLKELVNFSGEIVFSFDLDLDDLEEFLLMSTLQNLVISNSTFSFWASLVGNNNSKMVFAPKKYFKSTKNEQWIKNCQIMNIECVEC